MFVSCLPRLGSLLTLCLVAGCMSPSTVRHAPVQSQAPSIASPATEPVVPTLRRGRYTIVELSPELAQRDLLQQVVEIDVPLSETATAADALRQVLRHTGFRLCDRAEIALLLALDLPAPHRRLGPLTLRDALQTLAGPAWTLQVDNVHREVCFERADPVPAVYANPGAGQP